MASLQTLSLPSFEAVRDHLAESGGFTFNPRTGRFVTDRSGFVVANPKGNVPVVVASLTPDALFDAAWRNLSLLRKAGHYLGGWQDKTTGKVYLEVSEVFPSRDDAIAAATARGELAIFDLSTLSDIRLDAR